MINKRNPRALMFVFAAICFAAMLTSGCTSVKVRPVDAGLDMSHIFIQKNEKVAAQDFISVLIDGCSRHGISTSVVTNGYTSGEKDFTLQYTALRNWDLGTYLTHAEIYIYRNRLLIGSAEYHLIADGGFSLFKWQGTEAKIGPVIDELLQNYKPTK
ncbi:MAG: hypothetical protein HZA11_00625 [Nitrospirae bacterium]|nr:hypothetical protein [Nitrospirota bacterium]